MKVSDLKQLIRECVREVLREAAPTKSTPKLKKCDYCGIRRADVKRSPDPYKDEVYNDHTLHNLCNGCIDKISDKLSKFTFGDRK